MAAQPIPAAFKLGTEVTRIVGLPNLKLSISEGIVTRTTKTLAEVTFSPVDGPQYMHTYVYTPRYKVAEEYLTRKGQDKYSRTLDEVYLSDSQRVQDAHTGNASIDAQIKAKSVAEALSGKDRRWITREDVQATIDRLTAELDALPTRQTL